MAEFVIYLYDSNVRTNYVERRVEADDRLAALSSFSEDNEVTEEVNRKFSKEKDISKLISSKSYKILEI